MKHLISKILKDFLLEDKKKWTKDMVHKIALDYQTKSEFNKYAKAAYAAAKKYGWFDEVTSHMISPQIKWTKEMIASEAKKYKTKEGFRKGSPKAYSAAYGWGIMDEVSQHMVPLGDLFNRLVYAYEFPDNTAYVGLTHDKDERDYLHKIKGPIHDYINSTGLNPTLKLISADYINALDAQKLEACTIEEYRNNGWKLLNKAKAGSLGMCKVFWTKERVQSEANKYKKRFDFQKKSPKAYNAAYRNGWLNQVCDHMEKNYIDWTEDLIKKEVMKYKTLKDFRTQSSAYKAAQRFGIFDDVTKNLTRAIENWTDENLMDELSKHDSISDLRKNNNSAHTIAYQRFGKEFLNNFYGSVSKISWTPELLKKEAQKYKNRLEFLKGSESAYKAAQRQGILDDLIKDMEPDFIWDEEKVRQEASKYNTRMDFKNGSKTAYRYALKLGILDELIPSLRPRKN